MIHTCYDVHKTQFLKSSSRETALFGLMGKRAVKALCVERERTSPCPYISLARMTCSLSLVKCVGKGVRGQAKLKIIKLWPGIHNQGNREIGTMPGQQLTQRRQGKR